jgi:hypothetical protein
MKTTQKDRIGAAIIVPLVAKITDISAASSTFVVSPVLGRITKIYSTLQNAVTSGDAALTFEIGGVEITDSAITVANSGSAAGTVDSSTPSNEADTNIVAAGQAVELITDGGSTDSCETVITLAIEPSR